MSATGVSEPAIQIEPPSQPRRRQRSRLLLIGGVLAVLGAVAGVVVLAQIDQREPVIGLARAVPFGQQITEQDLRQVMLPAGTGLATISWTRTSVVLGRTSTTDLLPGQLMTPDAVTSERLPSRGQAVVGVAVEPGMLPVTPLVPRDAVLVVAAGETAGSGTNAIVLITGDVDVRGRRTVDLLVTDADAPRVARLAADGRAVLVLVARR